ncbi:MAG: hypothetical protein JXQ75_22120 [Phycisphaerae bacterium]|nr:hypothetical protein [Phycisphaerae bacterium]
MKRKKQQRRTKAGILDVNEGGVTHRVRHRNVVGRLINFRGLVYAPVNENGVIFLFGKVAADLNMYVETIRPGYPDCVAKRYIGKGKWEELRIEFEFRSSDFVRHKHHSDDCDAIVCWIHDWKECPKKIEVIELQGVTPQLSNPVTEEPDKVTELSQHNIDDLFEGSGARPLYDELHPRVMKIHRDIWRKVGERNVTYYSPERVFAYLKVQKKGLRLTVFTNSKKLSGVESMDYERGGQKWGRLYVKSQGDIVGAARALKSSHRRISEAVSRGENTGWYAEQD